jgi:hypothetical protein
LARPGGLASLISLQAEFDSQSRIQIYEHDFS